jgi:uncharacterized membrane protein
MRSLSAVLGLLTIPFFYLLTRRLATHRVALIAVFLLAISPFHVWYSQEMRNYALLILVSVLSQLCFLRVLDRGSSKDWFLYALTILAAIFTNLSGIFLPLGHGVYLLIRRRDLLLRFVLVQVVLVLIVFPWLRDYRTEWSPEMIGDSGALRVTNFHPMALPFAFSVFSVGFTVGPSLDEMNRDLNLRMLIPFLWYFIPVAVLFGWGFVRGLLATRKNRDGLAFYLTWIGTPLILVSLFAIINLKVFNARYLAVAFPAYLIILASGFDLGSTKRRAAVLVLVVAACGVSLWNHYFNPRYWKPDVRSAVRYVEANVREGDAVCVYSVPHPFEYYYQGEIPSERIPWWAAQGGAQLDEFMNDLSARSDRVWLVDYRSWYLDRDGVIARRFDRDWKRLDHEPFIGMTVSLYGRPSVR